MADGRKPIIAAVNGVVIGGALEMMSNLDVVIAGEGAVLSLPEAKRGVATGGGGIPRFVFLIGRQKGESRKEEERSTQLLNCS